MNTPQRCCRSFKTVDSFLEFARTQSPGVGNAIPRPAALDLKSLLLFLVPRFAYI
jgi:hypothetical protein